MSTIRKKNKITLVATMLVILGVAIFSGCIGSDQGTTLVIDGSTTVFPIAQAEAERYRDQHSDVDIQVTGTGSANGISAVGSGKVDIGMSSREIKSSEMAAYPDVVFVNTTIAIDGIAIIVHPSNSVSNLTISQVKGIYNGTITSWGELGGGSGNIVLVGRDSASGTREYF